MLLRFKDLYKTKIIPELKEELGFKNIMEVPRLMKIVLSMGVKDAVAEKKALEHASGELTLIAGQKTVNTDTRKSIASFKLRKGMSIGCKVTLRKDRMYAFLERFTMIALPRVRDFRGFSNKSFDGKGNFNLGVKEHIIFPEINYDKIDKIRGLNITIVTSTDNQQHAKALLTKFNLPFN
ncbi:MAG: 50S ribosomal protein L5 [Rickettsiales bacterium]|nr:50S ribosomal protein L5 [Rickettsiales bacterium]